jgi:hypothetical protein
MLICCENVKRLPRRMYFYLFLLLKYERMGHHPTRVNLLVHKFSGGQFWEKFENKTEWPKTAENLGIFFRSKWK